MSSNLAMAQVIRFFQKLVGEVMELASSTKWFMARLRSLLWGVASALLCVGAWGIACSTSRFQMLPTPWSVVHALAESVTSGQFLANSLVSLKRVLIGTSIAAFTGIVLGLSMAVFPVVRCICLPIIELIRSIPPLAWIPIAITLFGIGDHPAYFVIFLGTFYPIFTNTMHGVASIPRRFFEVAEVFGATRLQRVAHVLLPASVPSIFSGIKISIGFGWMCVVAAEMIAVTSGLGNQVQYDRNVFKLDHVLADMIEIGAVGLLMSFALTIIEVRFFKPRPTGDSESTPNRLSIKIADPVSPHQYHPRGAVVQIAQVSYASVPGLSVVSDVSLDVASGEVIAITGPSGSGKTTLLRAVAGLIPTHAGTIRINGSSPTNHTEATSMVFQEDSLFPWLTLIQNVTFASRSRSRTGLIMESDAQRLLDAVGLGHKAFSLPAHLSGGQRQRAELARALAAESALLLLDEPFGALDIATRLQLQDDISQLLSQHCITTLLVTHDVSEAVFMADRIFVLSGRPGRFVASVAVDAERPRPATFRKSTEFAQSSAQLFSLLTSTTEAFHEVQS